MKIDFDTLIYLIVSIIIVVVGALGKKNKPRQPLGEGIPGEQAAQDIQEENLENRFRMNFEEPGEDMEILERETEEDYVMSSGASKILEAQKRGSAHRSCSGFNRRQN